MNSFFSENSRSRRPDGKTEVFDAVETNDLKKLRGLVEKGHHGLNKKEYKTGYSPLYLAIVENKKQLVDVLLSADGIRVDLSVRKKGENEPVHKAPHLVVQHLSLNEVVEVLNKIFKKCNGILSGDKDIVCLFLARICEMSSEYAKKECSMPYKIEDLDEKERAFILKNESLIESVLSFLSRYKANPYFYSENYKLDALIDKHPFLKEKLSENYLIDSPSKILASQGC